MNYEVLYLNDNDTAKVRMTIGDSVLEQDFDTTDLDTNVKQGMAIFQAELDNNKPAPAPDITLNQIVTVTSLPTIPLADFQPEQPVDIGA